MSIELLLRRTLVRPGNLLNNEPVANNHVRESGKEKRTECFKDILQNAGALIIGRELTDTGDEVKAQTLADELKACTISVLGFLGNHGHEKGQRKLIRKILQNDHEHNSAVGARKSGNCF